MKTLTQHITEKLIVNSPSWVSEKLMINKNLKYFDNMQDIIKNFLKENEDVLNEYEVKNSSAILGVFDVSIRRSHAESCFYKQSPKRIEEFNNFIKKFDNCDVIYKFRHGTKRRGIFDTTYEILKGEECLKNFKTLFKNNDFSIDYISEDDMLIINIGTSDNMVTFIGIS